MRFVSPSGGGDKIVMQGFNVEQDAAAVRRLIDDEGPDIMAGEQRFDDMDVPLNAQADSAINMDQQLDLAV